MFRLSHLTATALVAAALTPAAALAADNELRGAPQMFRTGERAVTVHFTTDERIDRSDTRVQVSGRGTARTIKADGRHGRDFKYVARIKLRRDVEVGRKYTVKFRLDGGDVVKRLVRVR